MSLAKGAVFLVRRWRRRGKEILKVGWKVVGGEGGVRLLKLRKAGEVGKSKGFVEGWRCRKGCADGGGGRRKVSHCLHQDFDACSMYLHEAVVSKV